MQKYETDRYDLEKFKEFIDTCESERRLRKQVEIYELVWDKELVNYIKKRIESIIDKSLI